MVIYKFTPGFTPLRRLTQTFNSLKTWKMQKISSSYPFEDFRKEEVSVQKHPHINKNNPGQK